MFLVPLPHLRRTPRNEVGFQGSGLWPLGCQLVPWNPAAVYWARVQHFACRASARDEHGACRMPYNRPLGQNPRSPLSWGARVAHTSTFAGPQLPLICLGNLGKRKSGHKMSCVRLRPFSNMRVSDFSSSAASCGALRTLLVMSRV
jgi:hypothetical protein